MTKIKLALFLLSGIALNSCINSNPKESESSLEKDSKTSLVFDSVKETSQAQTQYFLALSEGAIQVVNANNGSTSQITFGMPFEQVITAVKKILNSNPSININKECGAGPLKFAMWDNGLNLLFQEKNGEWLFAGWAANQIQKQNSKLTTMVGIGVGSTRREMESAYKITVSETTLGDEFSAKNGNLFGLFDGPSKDAKIINLWSGLSCNFR